MERFSYEETHAPIGNLIDMVENQGIFARVPNKLLYSSYSGVNETEFTFVEDSVFRLFNPNIRGRLLQLEIDGLSADWENKIGAFVLAQKTFVTDENDTSEWPREFSQWQYQMRFAPVTTENNSRKLFITPINQLNLLLEYDLLLPIKNFPFDAITTRAAQVSLKDSVLESHDSQLPAWSGFSKNSEVPIQSRITISTALSDLKRVNPARFANI